MTNIVYGAGATIKNRLYQVPPTAANFPACKHFFQCLDTDGVLRDSIGGVYLPSGQVLNYESGPVGSPGTLVQTYNPTLQALENNVNPYPNMQQVDYLSVSGNWASFAATDAVLLVFAGRVTNPNMARVTIGTPGSTLAGGVGIAAILGSNNANPTLYGAFQDKHSVIGYSNPDPSVRTASSGAFATISSGGTGYADGQVAAVFTAGTQGGGAAGYFTALGGSLVSYTATNYGSGYYGAVDVTKNGTVAPATGNGTADVGTWGSPRGGFLPADVGRDIICALSFIPGNYSTLMTWDANTGAVLLNNNAPDLGSNLNPGAFTPSSYIKMVGMSLYGLSLHGFANGGLPTNWQSAAIWMGKQWAQGNRAIYPPWAGLT